MTDQSNDADIDGKFLGTISSDFIHVCDTLKEGAYQIKARGISDYPIFPICKADLPFGQLLLGKNEVSTQWNYYASTADEFQQLGFIDKEKFDSFGETYKDPEEFCCLFVVDKEFTNFLFIPYPED
ncbi:hypothetical protein [Cytophaga aurantiaca]|uniref:hypothetical protein n=1 Tax=Cytophaga aurantiaca TaxID=29530 RepID=UPI0003771E10|nr:hypothetical protein [Cytophaga aurantiaca]